MTDAVVVSKLVDGAIVVVGSGMVQRDQLARTLELLGVGQRAGCSASCSTGCRPRPAHHYGGYGYEAAAEHEATPAASASGSSIV